MTLKSFLMKYTEMRTKELNNIRRYYVVITDSIDKVNLIFSKMESTYSNMIVNFSRSYNNRFIEFSNGIILRHLHPNDNVCGFRIDKAYVDSYIDEDGEFMRHVVHPALCGRGEICWI